MAEPLAVATINGRSESELITVNGREDPAASRRVEIQFRLKDEEMIRNMMAVIQTSDTERKSWTGSTTR